MATGPISMSVISVITNQKMVESIVLTAGQEWGIAMAEVIVLCAAWVTTCAAVIVAHFKVSNPMFPFWVFAFPALLTYTYLTRG